MLNVCFIDRYYSGTTWSMNIHWMSRNVQNKCQNSTSKIKIGHIFTTNGQLGKCFGPRNCTLQVDYKYQNNVSVTALHSL